MLHPPYLQEGDKVGIVCTARKISGEEIAPAVKVLEAWGLEPVIGRTVGMESNQFAGDDKERALDLQLMLDNQEIKAVFFARGGYGTVRLINLVDFSSFVTNPKWVIGYSDITVMHSLIHSNFKVQTLHATMLINFEKNTPEVLPAVKDALMGNPINYEIPAHQLNRGGTCEGLLTGGNLSVLYSLIGTRADLDLNGKVLFIEDLDEYLYHIDRMMMNFEEASKLETLAGLIVGGMTDMNDNDIPFGKTAEEIVREHVDKYDFPVCFGFPAGHIDDNMPLVFGRDVKLEVGGDGCVVDFN